MRKILWRLGFAAAIIGTVVILTACQEPLPKSDGIAPVQQSRPGSITEADFDQVSAANWNLAQRVMGLQDLVDEKDKLLAEKNAEMVRQVREFDMVRELKSCPVSVPPSPVKPVSEPPLHQKSKCGIEPIPVYVDNPFMDWWAYIASALALVLLVWGLRRLPPSKPL